MRIKVLTLFPEMLRPMLGQSILARAISGGRLSVDLIDIREYTKNKHRNADDYPFGGGAGMVMMAQPIVDAMREHAGQSARRIYLSPRGRTLNQRIVEQLAQLDEIVLLCGHYEGVDQRAIDLCIDEELSIGDYVLTGGELAALVVIDSVARLIDGVLGSGESSEDESFSSGGGAAAGLLEYPQYTRPAVFEGIGVPAPLLGGNHAEIDRWRRRQALKITRGRRADLLAAAALSQADRDYLRALDALDALTDALDAAGIAWRDIEDARCESFAADWLRAFVPQQNLRAAKRRCLPKRGRAALHLAFAQGFAPCEGQFAHFQECICFLYGDAIGVEIPDASGISEDFLRGFDGICLCDALFSRTLVCAGGALYLSASSEG